MEKLVLTSFISPTNCNIQRHTFSGEAREYRSVDHRGVWKTRYNLSAHKPSRLNVVTLCVKLHHHVLFTRSQHTNAECFIYVLKANSKQTYPKSFSFNTAVWKAKGTAQMSEKYIYICLVCLKQPCLLCCLKHWDFSNKGLLLASYLFTVGFLKIYVNYIFWY